MLFSAAMYSALSVSGSGFHLSFLVIFQDYQPYSRTGGTLVLNRCILVRLPVPLFAQALLSPSNAPCASANSTLLVDSSTQVCKTPQRLPLLYHEPQCSPCFWHNQSLVPCLFSHQVCMLLWLLLPPISQSSRAFTELR